MTGGENDVRDVFHPAVAEAVERWRPLLSAWSRVARETYFWERESS